MMSTARSFSVRCAASTTAVKAPAAKTLKALNITQGSLASWGGRTTKNIDGTLYDITLNSDDSVTVVNRAQQIQYPAIVGEDAEGCCCMC